MNDQTLNCKKLWIAVLHRGVLDARDSVFTKRRDRFVFRKDLNVVLGARAWVMSHAKHFNSFLSLCELCGISASKIRASVREAIGMDDLRRFNE